MAHPWGHSGEPTVAQLQGRLRAAEAELARRDFDMQGALALHQAGVHALRHKLADAIDARARAEQAVRDHLTWGQYRYALDPDRMGSLDA